MVRRANTANSRNSPSSPIRISISFQKFGRHSSSGIRWLLRRASHPKPADKEATIHHAIDAVEYRGILPVRSVLWEPWWRNAHARPNTCNHTALVTCHSDRKAYSIIAERTAAPHTVSRGRPDSATKASQCVRLAPPCLSCGRLAAVVKFSPFSTEKFASSVPFCKLKALDHHIEQSAGMALWHSRTER